MLLQRGAVLPRKSVKKPRPTPVARGVITKYMVKCSGKQGGTFIEPFAGGAAISLSLLLEGTASHIVLNDKDKAIFAFWSSILEETDRFIDNVQSVRFASAGTSATHYDQSVSVMDFLTARTKYHAAIL